MSRTTNWSSSAFALAAVGITQVTSSLQFMAESFPDAVVIKAGVAILALQWLIVGFSFVITIGETIIRPLKDAYQSGDGTKAGMPTAPKPPALPKPPVIPRVGGPVII
ncbi:hypothetical protein J1614_004405 [Plenodomus biglobosus]|nr:hypothetical protein J1614_004405 [Plenodomus biglobosus]